MENKFKFWLGTIIAYILIIIYAGAVYAMIFEHDHFAVKPSTVQSVSGIETITALVGGLISALIISILASTKPNEDIVSKLTGTSSKADSRAIVIYAYVIIWLITGVAALIMGTVLTAFKGPFVITVSDIGTTWLATAVASGYAYFGINSNPS